MQQFGPIRITANTDTTLIAAPAASFKLKLHRASVFVEALGSSALLRFEDGAGGTALAAFLAANGNDHPEFKRPGRQGNGIVLTAATLLSAESTGTGTWIVWGEYEIIPDH